MRVDSSAHTERLWKIHEIAPDFEIEDVWEYRTPGAGSDDFPVMMDAMRASGGPEAYSWPVRILFAIRWKLGELLGWERELAGVGSRVASLRDSFPAHLRDLPRGPDSKDLPFTSLYVLEDESAQEIANRTVHAVMHLGWVPDKVGDGYHLQMAVLVKPNGLLGRIYMALIKPFRYLIVYPTLTRVWERAWLNRQPTTQS